MAQPTDIKGKIRNLLALAESPNENEAKAALLKARELMAKHKLTEMELGKPEGKKVLNIKTDITFSKRRDPWISELSAVIGENYCCKGYRSRKKGQQTYTIGFIGLEDDVEICIAIFKYAVDCVRAENERIRKENDCYVHQYVKDLCDSYGYGFKAGVEKAFNEQQEENKAEWGLVLVTPKEVQDTSQYLGHEKFKARIEDYIDPDNYWKGYSDGEKFDPSRRIGEGNP